jgi:predicted transcriptional regulator
MNDNNHAAAQSSSEDLVSLTADIVAAHVSNNTVSPGEIPALIGSVHGALSGLGHEAPAEERPEPAVSVRSSVKNDHLVCLEDGKKFKMLKRHLIADHAMTPDEYRARWGLPSSYPMVAPDYAEKRRDLAKKIGLGRKPGESASKKAAPKTQAKKIATPRKKPAASKRVTKPAEGTAE